MKLLVLILSFVSFHSYVQAQNTRFFESSDSLLSMYVRNGRVDYLSLYEDRKSSALDDLIDHIDSNSWTEAEEKAYLINVYNLAVLHKVVKNYPIKSPMDIGDFFDAKDIKLNGEKISLNQIENDLLRKKYKDPRLHFALVCGAIGCPVLQSEAYTPEQVEEQLEKQTRRAINDPTFVYQDASQDATMVSEIFMWYREDFGGSNDGIFEFINKYSKEEFREDFPIDTYPYNWALNEQVRETVIGNQKPTDTLLDKPDDFTVQTYTVGSLLGKNKFDFTLFNTLYTQNKNNWMGITYTDKRETFVTHLVQVTYGISKSKRVNIGLDINFKNSGKSVDTTYSGIKSAFQYSNTDSTRVGITSLGARVKIQPFKKLANFTFQSTFLIPTIEYPEGTDTSSGAPYNRYWADWDRLISWNQFFYAKTWGKVQLFTEVDLLFRIKKFKSQYTSMDLPLNLFLSYFPTKKITVYVMAQHVARFTNDAKKELPKTDWVVPMNYSATGIGFKYNIIGGLNIELLYTNFWRGKNSGLGETFNIGIRYLMI